MPSSAKPPKGRQAREHWDSMILAAWGIVLLSRLVPHRYPPRPLRGAEWISFVGCLVVGLALLWAGRRGFQQPIRFRMGQAIQPEAEPSGRSLARAVGMALLGAPLAAMLVAMPLLLFGIGAALVTSEACGPAGAAPGRWLGDILTYVGMVATALATGHWSAWRVGRWGPLMGGLGVGLLLLLLTAWGVVVDHRPPAVSLGACLYAAVWIGLGVAGGWLAARRARPVAPAS